MLPEKVTAFFSKKEVRPGGNGETAEEEVKKDQPIKSESDQEIAEKENEDASTIAPIKEATAKAQAIVEGGGGNNVVGVGKDAVNAPSTMEEVDEPPAANAKKVPPISEQAQAELEKAKNTSSESSAQDSPKVKKKNLTQNASSP